MALGFYDAEETGNDSTLIVVEADDEVSRAAVTGAFADVGLDLLFMDSRAEGGGRLVLVEIAGFVVGGRPASGRNCRQRPHPRRRLPSNRRLSRRLSRPPIWE